MVSVVTGVRSSWLTSAAKRASCSIRSCRASTMWLKVPTRAARSGSSVAIQARVEVARGDPHRRSGHLAERRQDPPARGPTDQRTRQGREAGADGQGDAQRRQRAVELLGHRDLVVLGVDRRAAARRRPRRPARHVGPADGSRPRDHDVPDGPCRQRPGVVERGGVPLSPSRQEDRRPAGWATEPSTSLTSAPDVSRLSRTRAASVKAWRSAVRSRCSIRKCRAEK